MKELEVSFQKHYLFMKYRETSRNVFFILINLDFPTNHELFIKTLTAYKLEVSFFRYLHYRNFEMECPHSFIMFNCEQGLVYS
jgi:hypothetical protein